MITACSLTNKTLTLILNGSEILNAKSDHPKWNEIVEAFKQQNEDLLRSLISLKTVIETYTVGGLSVNSTGVTYNGNPLHTIDAERVMAFIKDGLPYKPIANYISRKMANPSPRAIQEMYAFLEHKGMPLTPDGKFIAYKGVGTDFYSISGNTQTKVLRGKVSEDGRILNTIGSIIEVERSSVNDNYKVDCAAGLHAGTIEYARGFGPKIILVEIDPADVVSIPEDCNCQKLRCCKYKVIGEYTGPLPNTYTNEFSDNNSDEDLCKECGLTLFDCNCSTCSGCDQLSEECTCDTEKSETPEPLKEENCCGGNCGCDTKKETQLSGELEIIYKNVLTIIEKFEIDFNLINLINPNTKFSEIGFDSLDGVEFCMFLEESYNIEIPDEEYEKYGYSTIMEVCIALHEKLHLECKLSKDELFEYKSGIVHDSTPSLLNNKYFNEGKDCGLKDKLAKKHAHYLPKDAEGADSENHEKYIYGYIYGYNLS